MAKRKAPKKPTGPVRIYAWAPDRKASRACIRHHIAQAIRRKRWAQRLDPSWYEMASTVSKEWASDLLKKSIKAIARGTLNYQRYRAFASSSGGSYAPTGWPLDRPAREAWAKLNPEHFHHPATEKDAA
jgi:hypothetical protein